MDSILATAGRLITPPRQPRPGRLDQWTVVLGSIISLFGLLLQAQAATSVTLAWDPSGASGIAGYRPTAPLAEATLRPATLETQRRPRSPICCLGKRITP